MQLQLGHLAGFCHAFHPPLPCFPFCCGIPLTPTNCKCTAADFPKGFGRFDPVSPILNCPPHRPASPYYRWRFCDMGRLPSCVVYSVGPVQQDYAFEKDVIAFTKCEVHTLDCTTEGKSIDKKRHKHHKLCIGEGKPDHKGWQEIVKQLGHHTRGIEALKIGASGWDVGCCSCSACFES